MPPYLPSTVNSPAKQYAFHPENELTQVRAHVVFRRHENLDLNGVTPKEPKGKNM